MTTHTPIGSSRAADAPEPRTRTQAVEDDATLAGIAAADALGAVDVAAIGILGLLLVPPLAILAVVVIVPLLAIGLALALLAAVVTLPYVLVQVLRGHHGGHAAVLAHRLRAAGRAVLDLAPHRIDAAARRHHTGR
jgi:hypothetical protein